MLTRVRPIRDDIDPSLQLLLVEDTGEPLIIGLSAVLIDRVYIVDVSKFYKRGYDD